MTTTATTTAKESHPCQHQTPNRDHRTPNSGYLLTRMDSGQRRSMENNGSSAFGLIPIRGLAKYLDEVDEIQAGRDSRKTSVMHVSFHELTVAELCSLFPEREESRVIFALTSINPFEVGNSDPHKPHRSPGKSNWQLPHVLGMRFCFPHAEPQIRTSGNRSIPKSEWRGDKTS